MIGQAGKGRGRGRMGAGGPLMECVCPMCGTRVPKTRGTACASLKCPKCGAFMVRG